MTLIGLLVMLIVFGLVWWVANMVLAAFGIGDPVATLIRVVLVIAFVLYLLSAFGVGTHGLRLS